MGRKRRTVMPGSLSRAARVRTPPRVTSTYTLLKLGRPAADTSPMAPSREQGIWMLERLVAGAVRYGHDLAVVHLAVSADADDPTLAARLGAALRGADALIRWEPGV